MQDRALLGDVDFFPVEHGIDSCPQAGLLRQVKKEPKRFIGYAIFGVVEVKTNGIESQTLTAFWVVRKKLPQMQL
jgi:hypothetical protein